MNHYQPRGAPVMERRVYAKLVPAEDTGGMTLYMITKCVNVLHVVPRTECTTEDLDAMRQQGIVVTTTK